MRTSIASPWGGRSRLIIAATMLSLVFCCGIEDARGQDGAVEADQAPAEGVGSRNGARTVGEYYGTGGAEGPAEETSFFLHYLKVLGWLVFVLALAVGTIIGLKKLRDKGGRVFGGSQPRMLEVVSRTALGPKHQLVVVRVGERALVLGLAPDGISNVCELSDPSEILAATRSSSFQDELANEEGSYDEEAPSDDSLSPYRREIERLQAMVGNWRFSQQQGGTS